MPERRLLCRRTTGWHARHSILSLLALATIAIQSPLAISDDSPGETRTTSEPVRVPAWRRVPESLEDLRAFEARIREITEKVRPSVVAFAGGSGVIVSEDGYVLTAAHVGQRAGRRLRISLADGRSVSGVTLGNDRGLDAGLVKITDEGEWPAVSMGESRKLEVGQWCLALGYPVSFKRGAAAPVRIGRVVRHNDRIVTSDCPIMGGDSGGPIFDLDGKVIGISSRVEQRIHRNYHVPVDIFRKSWGRFVKSEDFDSTDQPSAFLGVGPVAGSDEPKIGRTVEGSAAAKAGLEAGDVIVKFGGKKLDRYADLRPLIREKKPGDEIVVVVRRADEELTFKLKLGER